MTHIRAYEAVQKWLAESGCRIPGYAGAYLAGSFLEHDPGADWPADSDIDVMILCREDPVPQADKFHYEGTLIEASYMHVREFADPERVLTVHYLAYALSHAMILGDPDSLLAPLCAFVQAEYARPERLRARWRTMISEIRRDCGPVDPERPFHMQAMGWLFTASKSVFPLLIAAGRNCTVRKRLGAARAALEKIGRAEIMDEILPHLLGENFDPSCLAAHVNALESAFEAACRSDGPSRDYRFRSDISPDNASLSVGWCHGMLKTAHPEDCVFWLGATWTRCLTILCMDENPAYAGHLENLKSFLADLGISSTESFTARLAALESFLPRLDLLSEDVMAAVRAQKAASV